MKLPPTFGVLGLGSQDSQSQFVGFLALRATGVHSLFSSSSHDLPKSLALLLVPTCSYFGVCCDISSSSFVVDQWFSNFRTGITASPGRLLKAQVQKSSVSPEIRMSSTFLGGMDTSGLEIPLPEPLLLMSMSFLLAISLLWWREWEVQILCLHHFGRPSQT